MVGAESYAVGYMDEFSMSVGDMINSACTLTALSMTCMTSHSEISLAHFFTNIAFALSVNSQLRKETVSFDRLTVRFDF